ncbi:DUF348 domain-containing protein [Candidatus Saccharibacteria bacterium]|nr:DUF348 domain-containing protein [Candidatus Saccharibacteria bacterium]
MQQKFIRRKNKLATQRRRGVRKLKILSRHHFAVPIITFVVLALLSVMAYVFVFHKTVQEAENRDTHIVIVSYDKQTRYVPAEPQTVASLLRKLNIPLNPGDVVEPEADTRIVQDNFRINIYRAVPVNVIADDGSSTFAYSAATTPRSVARQAGVKVYAEDSVKTEPVTNFLKQGAIGEQVIVRRSTPVNLNLYGTAAPTRTLAKTVAGLLTEKGITLGPGATVQPKLTTKIKSNMQVFILAKGVSITSKTRVIAMPVKTIKDKDLTLGARAIRQYGSPGKELVTYQVKRDPKTKKVISKTIIQRVTIEKPVKQIVAVGTNVNIPKDKVGIMRAAGIRSSDYGYVDYIVSHEGGWNGVTKYNYSGSGAYGICQALPGSKMASAGADWRTNPVTQLRWCDGYAVGRFGSWAGAYSFWLSHHYW